MYRSFARTLILLIVAIGVTSCGGDGGRPPPPPPPPVEEFSYEAPADTGDGWQVGDLADEGFDTQMIIDMMNQVVDGSYEGIDSVVIARNNKLLLYWYDRRRELDEFDDWINNLDRERHVLHQPLHGGERSARRIPFRSP